MGDWWAKNGRRQLVEEAGRGGGREAMDQNQSSQGPHGCRRSLMQSASPRHCHRFWLWSQPVYRRTQSTWRSRLMWQREPDDAEWTRRERSKWRRIGQGDLVKTDVRIHSPGGLLLFAGLISHCFLSLLPRWHSSQYCRYTRSLPGAPSSTCHSGLRWLL